MQTSDFDYILPERLIAQSPLADRASSRMLVLHHRSGVIEHRHFGDVLGYLQTGDCLVLNDTRVLPARLMGQKQGSTTVVEMVLLKPTAGPLVWEVLARPGKRLPPGSRVDFGTGELVGEVLENTEVGGKLVQFTCETDLYTMLDRLGQMPLPPYIREKLVDKERYQTVYSRNLGSAAAPTAGLHFTPALLDAIRRRGVKTVFLTLHVGLGTFRPVQVDDVASHVMHSEYYDLSAAAADEINTARQAGNRVIAVGTTSVRTLETLAAEQGLVHAASGWTEIFIYPPYRFKAVDGLITNFHLPKSTLLMLVSAMAGRDNIMRAYAEAVKEEYRFFSFGDAMLII
ncbi:MAG TPA: tRNA preQ1(34) S-adenosylmethionine ribosyltransferase-isomerase QueA [Bacillota bacterium]|nr:tRNA preQ1(34) S-adenosylmethionine ribosyltransferase-isomerase QueA [Bacillota bacterium]